jgi:hypothetical protein
LNRASNFITLNGFYHSMHFGPAQQKGPGFGGPALLFRLVLV